MLEALLGGQRGLRGAGAQQPHTVRRREQLLLLHGDLLDVAATAVEVDRGVAGDLVEPRTPSDLGVAGPQPAQGGQKGLLGQILRAARVAYPARHEAADAALIAAVELLEGGFVSASHRRYELSVRARLIRGGRDRAASSHAFAVP